MEQAIKYTHLTSVILFMLIYLIKTFLLLTNNTEKLKAMTKMVKVPEMIVSFLFLGTGVYMLTQVPVINMFMIIKIVSVLASIPLAIVGFKKENKALASIAMLLIIGSYGLAEVSQKKREGGGTQTSATEMDGKILFANNCKGCHGADGTAGMSGAADLSVIELNDDEIKNVIKNGKGNMKSIDESLSAEQINAVVEYVKTLKK